MFPLRPNSRAPFMRRSLVHDVANSFRVSCGQRSSTVGPLEWLGKSLVEVFDEGADAVAEMLDGDEVATAKKATTQDAEPQFDLVEPRGAFGGVDEADAVVRGR